MFACAEVPFCGTSGAMSSIEVLRRIQYSDFDSVIHYTRGKRRSGRPGAPRA
jgi:hypothetical protein